MATIYSRNGFEAGPQSLITRSAGALRNIASYVVLGTIAMTSASIGVFAQCTNTGGVNVLIPFAQGTAVSSIITTLGAVNTASLAQTTAFVGTPSGAKPDEMGGGHWSRVIAGSVETTSNTSTTSAAPFIGNDTCRTTTKQDFIGTQAGMDISRLNFAGGGNIHWGVTSGFFDIDSKDKTPGEGSFSGDTQVAFAGLYMMINAGGFSFDAQARGDFYHTEMSDVRQAVFNQSLDAKGAAFLWNASYTFNITQSWFLRPSVGGVWSRTEVDKINVAGGLAADPALTNNSLTLPGTIEISPIDTLLGRASLTVGGTVTTGQLALQPFATASVFHEFAGNVTTRMSGSPAALGFPAPDFNATSTTTRVGTYAHFGIGVAGTIINTGWLGYIKGDYLTGDNIEAISVNAGLRYQFQPTQDAGSVKDGGGGHGYSGYNWTGFYAGTFTGGIHGTGDWVDALGSTAPKFSGYNLGGTIGYNQQFGHVVFGIEGDLGFANAKGGRDCSGGVDAFFFSCEADVNSLSTLTARVGYVRERALFFVKGGLAVADVEARTQANIPIGAQNAAFLLPLTGSLEDGKTLTGWALGGGVEFAITDRWSVKGEYLHFDLGKKTFQVFDDTGAGGVTLPADVHFKGDTVRIGVNYHFGRRDHYHEPMK